jgi:hypothetical protein
MFLRSDKKLPIAYVYSHDIETTFIRDDKTTFKSGSGLKLMEHSWMENNFVGFVEEQLTPEGSFYKTSLVWAGDYADKEPAEVLSTKVISQLVKDGSDLKTLETEGANLYDISITIPRLLPSTHVEEYKILPLKKTRYLVNHDKKEFVDKTKVLKGSWGNRVHPLPLLTCEGNNRGGGDFRGDEKELVGRWARDIISIESKKSDFPKDFVEIIFDLTE